GSVATGDAHPDAGRDLLVAPDQLQSPFLLEDAQVLRFVGWLAARIRMAPGFQLGRLHDMAGPREERGQLTVPARGDERSNVIEVQVAEHDQVDILRLESPPGERTRETGVPLIRPDVALLAGEPRAQPRREQAL